ncbi:biotin-dependent carboxyltransferase family protein [Pseudonocardia sp. KRD291]|uniref:5-oxoprolinase subunit C family protein n=1 Tax=Pseudonocardia sp. KRD291 TaxID=2792007 RepID=UPI001C4A1FA5|nr:biotin-dependent carboxyltransferase family protein [Pseudonocardia sp. KRD291]MBW0104254.1 biotin-dependent carboxyltransferase family protein [Pseudonocardia sp. KRD291]
MNARLEVLATGPQAVVTDHGRPGHAHLGVPPSGALDRPALDLANRLVGNPAGAAGLELLLGRTRLRARGAVTVAVTGPPVTLRAGGRAVSSHCAVRLPDGAELTVGAPDGGVRVYLAVRGGLEVPLALGSASTDLLSGLGPHPLVDGDVLAVGDAAVDPVPPSGPVPASVPAGVARLRVRLGPRDDWFADPTGDLTGPAWSVSPTGNRIGVRLDGPAPRRRPEREGSELPSEGMVVGAVQAPPGGPPVVFLADHPTTGGYPVIGVLEPDDVAVLAQARPGSTVRIAVVG